ncbi:MAG TPA: hypothetical protein VJT71_00965 [Pyrinomonadaceae bacterium]|nr:hypothetical protein [Pyrinomonadaceae bacterium]
MKTISRFLLVIVTPVALIPVFVIGAAAQPGLRRSAEEKRRALMNDTFRELMKNERETHATAPKSDAERTAMVKQIREDFRTIQDVNNRMMSQAWKAENIDYNLTSAMLGEINQKAARLKTHLSLPHQEKLERASVTASGVKEFKSALLLMDRSLMNFVNNRMFRENIIEVSLANQAAQDLENVIGLSSRLKKIADNLRAGPLSR